MNDNTVQILLVEDNPGDARLIREHLIDADLDGFIVETVHTLASAVERCSRSGIDAILLDLGLPDSIGLDTLKVLLSHAPGLPVLVLTGLDDEKIAIQAVQTGAQDYLLKGEINGAVILRALRYAIARKRAEVYREMGLIILDILNQNDTIRGSIGRILKEVKIKTQFEAVGLRLQDGDDFPYFAQLGFPEDFLLTENTLVTRSTDGVTCCSEDGKVKLDCICGLVLSGKTDPSQPFFTRDGSFWTNDAYALPSLTINHNPQYHPRTQCAHQGYASMALIPVKDKGRIVGLFHLSNHRKGCFSLESVELLESIAIHIGAALTRKQDEEVLRKSEARFHSYFDLPLHGNAITSPEKGWITVNERICSMLGYTQNELLNMTWQEMTHPDDVAADIEQFNRLLAGQIEQYHLEKRFMRKDGQVLWTNFAVGCVRESDGKVNHLIAVLDDITERKQTEAELQKIDKLQSIGTLAGGIAHDFNNILLGLFGNISLAMEELSIDHPSYAPIEEARKSMNRAIRLTHQLLTFAKGGAPIKENTYLGTMIEEIARFDLSGSNVILDYQQAPNLWPAIADKSQIQQVVSNLIINARQAMPKGGHLHITLENANFTEAFVPTLGSGKYIKIVIRDEGTGIDPKIVKLIFDPYFTTKQTGSGLGLATVWSVINKHGGYIDVASEVGKGTTFTFYLPASTSYPPVEPKSLAKEVIASSPARHAKILVMDDEKVICTLVAQMLTRCGYSVVTAPGGQETIELYKKALAANEPFDAVIMDLTIPGGIGGKETVQAILEFDPHVRAIVSSGYADDLVMANPAAYGFKDTVTKPYTVNVLRETVARVLQ